LSGDLLGIKSSGALFIGILTSRTVEDRLIGRFDLRGVYGLNLQEDARAKLRESTQISEDRHSGIIGITVSDHNRERSAAMAQAYVEELNRLVAELSTSAAHRERVFLEQRLSSVKQKLDQASTEFSRFSSEHAAIDIKEQGRAMINAAAAISGQLIATESELSGLEQIYNPNSVRIRAVKARAAELRSKLAELGGNAADDNEARENSAYPTLRTLPLLGVTYADLYRETKIQETVYETLTQQYELAKVQEAKETPSVKVLDAPSLPDRRSFPPRLQIAFLGICLAVGARGLWTLGWKEWADIDPHHPGKLFGKEVFQSVNSRMPWSPPYGSRAHSMTHRVWIRLQRRTIDVP
jgi:capsule polysaccharide export protein KpsE/RkpR